MDNEKFNAYAQRLAKMIESDLKRLGAVVTVTWNPDTKHFDLDGPGAEWVKANLGRDKW
jgi:hypothetical protein